LKPSLKRFRRRGLQIAPWKGTHGHGEGGIAAAMANVDTADNWKTHFRDTMRGGKFLNNWRMAQFHAQESPDRVRELEQWARSSTVQKPATFCSAPSAATPSNAFATSRSHRPRNDSNAAGSRRPAGH